MSPRPPSRIVFDPLLETGHGLLDRQHRELFERLAALLEASRQGRAAEEVRRMVDFLGEYVARHFAAEERLMAEADYPALGPHREEHRAFAAEYEALRAELREAGHGLSFVVRLSQRVTGWLRDHIYRADREMAGWLRRTADRV